MKIKLPTTEQLHGLQMLRLEALMRGASKAVVAGGCLRDLLLGRAVSDIDVFHEGTLTNLEDLTELELASLDPGYKQALAVFSSADITPVQYIQVEDIEQRLKTFSVSLSQIWLDDRELVLSDSFVGAVNRQELVFQRWASEAYRAKIKAKYPELAVVEQAI
jgi:hypothetical protein